MEVVGQIRFLPSTEDENIKSKLLVVIHMPMVGKSASESIYCLEKGKLIHRQGGKILSCGDIDKKRSFSKYGPVLDMKYFTTVTQTDCVAILQEKCFSIWQSHSTAFVQRYFEEVDRPAKINTFDYFAKGFDQVALQISSTIRYFEVGYGGLVHEIKTSKEESTVVEESLAACLGNLTASIRRCQNEMSDAKSLIKSILVELEGSKELIIDDSKLYEQISKRPRRTLISKEKKSIQTAAKFFEHSNEVLGILKIENTTNKAIHDLVLVPCICDVERLSYKIHYSCHNNLESGKNLKLIVQFNRITCPWRIKGPLEMIYLQYVDSTYGFTHRKLLNHTALQDSESSTQTFHPDHEKVITLKKIYLKKRVVIRSEFSNGKQIIPILVNRLHFFIDDIMKVYLRSGDKSFFLSCSEESDSHVNLTLYGQDENVLKIFCQELYTHLPDDMYMILMEEDALLNNTEPKSNRLEAARNHLLAEIAALEDVFKKSSPASVARVEQHIEGTRSVYESRRQMLLSKSVNLRIPLEAYMQHKGHLLKLEEETDKIFSDLLQTK